MVQALLKLWLKLTKGTEFNISLEKEILPGDAFLSGDAFTLKNTKFKVVSKTPKALKIIAL